MIKIGYLLSYDYELIFTSIDQVYNFVDRIFIAVDKTGKTWSGQDFSIPSSFFQKIYSYDTKNKICFFFDEFYIPCLSPIECETRERNMLLKEMGRGWCIQLDVDEYIYDFRSVSKFLRKYWFLTIFPSLTPVSVTGKLVTLYRRLPQGFLYIDNNERFSFITNQTHYTFTRNNTKNFIHFSDITVVHQSWARSEDEIRMKLKNWGHRDDFDTEKYFNFWKNIGIENYFDQSNFHPIKPEVWNKLKFLEANSISSFLKIFSERHPQNLKQIDLTRMGKAILKKLL